jgi:hypothetical protein
VFEVDRGRAAVGQFDLHLVRGGESTVAAKGGHRALSGQAGEPAGEAADDLVLPAAQLADVDRGFPERQPVLGHLPGLGDHLGRVQERLGRDAADVEADPAERGPPVDEDDRLAQVGCAEGRGVPAGAGAQDEHVGAHVSGPGRGCRRRGGRGGRGGSGRRVLGA